LEYFLPVSTLTTQYKSFFGTFRMAKDMGYLFIARILKPIIEPNNNEHERWHPLPSFPYCCSPWEDIGSTRWELVFAPCLYEGWFSEVG
jgi:hypothetical protein